MRPTNEWFQPERLGTLYRITLGLANLLFLVPAAAAAWWLLPSPVAWAGPAVLVALDAFVVYWIARFEGTATFRLTDEAVEYRRGVWWRKHSTVPYAKITNVESAEDPIHRYLGTGTVRLQTAGTGQMQPELSLNGLADYEAVKDQILDAARDRAAGDDRDRTPAGTSPHDSGDRAVGEPDLLAEVRRIRELLETDG